MENSKINIAYFICESLANNPKAYKHIDKIYNEDKKIFVQYIKEFSKESIEYEGSLVQEYYFKKVYAIISANEIDKVIYIMKMTYKKSAQYVKDCDIINLFKFIKNLRNKRDMSDDEFNGSLLATIVLAKHENKKIDKNDFVYQDFLNVLILRTKMIEKEHEYSYSNISKEQRKYLRDIQLTFMNKYDIDNRWLPCAKTDGDFRLERDKMTEEESKYHFMMYMLDIEHININALVGNKFLKDKDIQELINCYLMLQRFLGKDKNKDNKNNIDYEDLYSYLIPSVYLRYVIRAYKECKDYFFKNIADDDTVELLKLKDDELSTVKQENFVLKGENAKLKNSYNKDIDQLKEEIRILENNNKKLQQEINERPNIEDELHSLRNFIFDLDNNKDNEYNKDGIESNIIDINKLNNTKSICFGGSDDWINKIKKELPNWTFVSAKTENFDTNLLKDKDYVFINIISNSHGIYYKVINNKEKDSKLCFINTINKERSLNEINKYID